MNKSPIKYLVGKRAEKAFSDLQRFSRTVPNYFLVYGSCLASKRENQFIPWDKDIDIGIFQKDFNWDIINDLIKKNFKITRIFGKEDYGLEIVLHKNVKIDFWLFYERENDFFNCLWDGDKPIEHFYSKDLLAVGQGTLYKKKFNSLSEKYLTHVYGDWKNPQKQFNWRTDHKCTKTG